MENKSQIVVIAPKVRLSTMFHYVGFEDVPNLIKFVGRSPVLNLDMSLQYKKVIIVPDSYVEVNGFGDVLKVIPAADLEKHYEVRELLDWNEQNANALQAKSKSESKPETKKGKK